MTHTSVDKAFENLEMAVVNLSRAARLGLAPVPDAEFTHVDNWLDTICFGTPPSTNEVYARFVLELMRFPGWKLQLYKDIIEDFPLYCKWNGSVYRVTGASALGDVWLNFPNIATSYQHRVSVTECLEWAKSANP